MKRRTIIFVGSEKGMSVLPGKAEVDPDSGLP